MKVMCSSDLVNLVMVFGLYRCLSLFIGFMWLMLGSNVFCD